MTDWKSICLLAAIAGFIPATSAIAAPTVDGDAGTWLDDCRDALGFVPTSEAESFNIGHDPVGRLVTLVDGASPGQFSTTATTPSSLSAWTTIRLSYTASAIGDVMLTAVDADTGTLYPLMLEDGTAGYDGEASLASVPATVKRLSVRVGLKKTVIAPTVQSMQISWRPRAVLTLGMGGPVSARASTDINYEVNVAVSFVPADGLVLWAPLPVGSNAQGDAPPASFRSNTLAAA